MLYYFVLSSLPPIGLKVAPEMTFKELKDLLYLNLTPKDLEALQALLLPIEIYNIRALWLGEALDDRGSLTPNELEEALLVREGLPQFLVEFLERYETKEERINAFPSLFASLYTGKEGEMTPFLRKFYRFERERTLILAALRAKRAHRNIVKELQFEDPYDPLVADILAQKDASDYEPPQEYEDLKILFVENEDDPEKLNRAMLEYRLKKIEEREEEENRFSIDQVLAFVARFLIVDSWFRLDQEKGKLEVRRLVDYE
jgi:hypothetical protein